MSTAASNPILQNAFQTHIYHTPSQSLLHTQNTRFKSKPPNFLPHYQIRTSATSTQTLNDKPLPHTHENTSTTRVPKTKSTTYPSQYTYHANSGP